MGQDEVVHVAYEAAGMPRVAPTELSALLWAPAEAARDEAWAGFVRAYTDRILRIAPDERAALAEREDLLVRQPWVHDELQRLQEEPPAVSLLQNRPGRFSFVGARPSPSEWERAVTSRRHPAHAWGTSCSSGTRVSTSLLRSNLVSTIPFQTSSPLASRMLSAS